MANPRQIVAFHELHTQRATFTTDGSLTFDATAPYGIAKRFQPVKIVGNGQVGLATDGDVIFGSLDRMEGDDMAVVAYHGMTEFAVAAALAAGSSILGSTSGNVKVGTTGAKGTVITQGGKAGALTVIVYLP